jgi:hypothetical protein
LQKQFNNEINRRKEGESGNHFSNSSTQYQHSTDNEHQEEVMKGKFDTKDWNIDVAPTRLAFIGAGVHSTNMLYPV